MIRICFKPFDFRKWITLGFCAFLAECGEAGGSSFQDGMRTQATNKMGFGPFDGLSIWISQNSGLFYGIISAGVLAAIALSLLVTWISSRGKFMILDGIIKNQGKVKEPWREYKREGNSLFLFSIVLGLCMIAFIIINAGISLAIAIPDFQQERLTSFGIASIILASGAFLLFIIFATGISFFTKAFLIPTMYMKRMKALEACSTAYSVFIAGNILNTLLLGVFLFLFKIGLGTLMIGILCMTCCISGLPYISAVVFLPITVFFTCYVLCYLQQFGNDWIFFKQLSICPFCHYDQRGLAKGHPCPECGKSTLEGQKST